MMSKIKTDWDLVIMLLCVGVLGIMICGMAKWIDEQSQRIDRLEVEMIALKGPAENKKATVMWHGKEH